MSRILSLWIYIPHLLSFLFPWDFNMWLQSVIYYWYFDIWGQWHTFLVNEKSVLWFQESKVLSNPGLCPPDTSSISLLGITKSASDIGTKVPHPHSWITNLSHPRQPLRQTRCTLRRWKILWYKDRGKWALDPSHVESGEKSWTGCCIFLLNHLLVTILKRLT